MRKIIKLLSIDFDPIKFIKLKHIYRFKNLQVR